MKTIYYYIATAIAIVAGIVFAACLSNYFALGFAIGSLVLLVLCYSLNAKLDDATDLKTKYNVMQKNAICLLLYLQVKYKNKIDKEDNLVCLSKKDLYNVHQMCKANGIDFDDAYAKLINICGDGFIETRYKPDNSKIYNYKPKGK